MRLKKKRRFIMKSYKWIILILAATLVLNIMLLNKIFDLDEQLKSFSSRINTFENQLNNTVVSIKNTVSEELEKQYALIIASGYEYGKADIAKGTINVTISVIPKDYAPETSAFLISDENEYPMVLENGIFKSNIKLSIYDQCTFDIVKFVSDNGIHNEKIDIVLSPRYDFLPIMNAKYRGQCKSVKIKDGYEATYNGQITINLERKSFPTQAKKIEMIEYLDGKELHRTDVPLNTKPFEIHHGDGSYSVPEEVLTPYDSEWQGPKVFYYQLENKKVIIPNGSTYEIYIEVTDDLGLLHRMCADIREISENGMPIDRVSSYMDGAAIYNAENGETLYIKTHPILK